MSKKRKKNSKPPTVRSNTSATTPQIKTAKLIQAEFSGPIPHPRILKEYDRIVPGAAARILKVAEDDAIHTREMEKRALEYKANEIKRGQIFGLVIGLATFSTAIISLYLGHEGAAMVLGGTTVVGLVTVFVTDRKLTCQEKNKKGDQA